MWPCLLWTRRLQKKGMHSRGKQESWGLHDVTGRKATGPMRNNESSSCRNSVEPTRSHLQTPAVGKYPSLRKSPLADARWLPHRLKNHGKQTKTTAGTDCLVKKPPASHVPHSNRGQPSTVTQIHVTQRPLMKLLSLREIVTQVTVSELSQCQNDTLGFHSGGSLVAKLKLCEQVNSGDLLGALVPTTNTVFPYNFEGRSHISIKGHRMLWWVYAFPTVRLSQIYTDVQIQVVNRNKIRCKDINIWPQRWVKRVYHGLGRRLGG